MKKKTIYIILGSIFALGMIACLIKLGMIMYQPKPVNTETKSTTETTEETAYTAPDESQAVIPTYTSVTTDETSPVYVSPVDFATLQSYNEDIYAWITIKDTNIGRIDLLRACI